MDKETNRSSTPTDPPSWIEELFHELQLFQADFRQIELASRELRLITLENQQLLRDLTSTMARRNNSDANLLSNVPMHRASTSNSTRVVASNRGPIPQVAPISTRATTSNVLPIAPNSTRATASNVARNSIRGMASPSGHSSPAHVNTNRTNGQAASTINRPRQPISSITSHRANQAVRNAAIPIPRTERSQPTNATRACWFHRQFGITSAKCLPPCGFVVPAHPILAAPINNIPALPIELPIEPINVPPAVANNDIPAVIINGTQPDKPTPMDLQQDPVIQEISIRPPLERNVTAPPVKRLSSSSSSDSEPSPSTSKQFKPADWNKLAKKETEPTSSSSDSDE